MTRQVRGLVLAFVLLLSVIGLAGNVVRQQSMPTSAVPVQSPVTDPTGESPTPTTPASPSASSTPSSSPSSANTNSSSPSSSSRPVVAAGASASPMVTAPPPFDPASLSPVPLADLQGTFVPDRSVHVADRYLQHYGASRVSWDQLLDRGRPLPNVSASCAKQWRKSGLDRRIDRGAATYLCLAGLAGRGFKPQGVGGTGTTDANFWLGDGPATERNIVVTSWYAHSGITKLVVIDLDQRRYNTVELVRPAGSHTFRKLSSHGSGLVWAGHYLYSSSLSELMMYNAGDIMSYGGKYVLPAIARWRAEGNGGLSSISIDRSVTPNVLQSINYTKRGFAYRQSFALADDGSLVTGSPRRDKGLALVATLGRKGTVARSVDTLVVPGKSFQGVASVGAYDLANSSSMRLNGRKGDTAVVLKDESVVRMFRMPHGNGQSIYLDYTRNRFVSVTEAGAQFLYLLPLRELTG